MGVALRVNPRTVSVAVAVFTRAPLVAVMVTVDAPPGVAAVVAIVIVVGPDPVTVVGLKVAVAPAGSPEAAKETWPLNPPSPVTVIVEVVEDPTFTAAGAVAAMEKSEPTVRLTAGALTITPLPVPVITTG